MKHAKRSLSRNHSMLSVHVTHSRRMCCRNIQTPLKNIFENQYEMVSILNVILATQRRERDVRRVMSRIQDGGHYFFDVDIAEEQARSLGWRRKHEILCYCRLGPIPKVSIRIDGLKKAPQTDPSLRSILLAPGRVSALVSISR